MYRPENRQVRRPVQLEMPLWPVRRPAAANSNDPFGEVGASLAPPTDRPAKVSAEQYPEDYAQRGNFREREWF
jgi:hypothetical protein